MLDRFALLETLGPPGQLHAEDAAARKATAVRFVRAILNAITAEGREADAWEAHDLAAAIGHIRHGWYFAAIAVADRALAPPNTRAPEWVQALENGDRITMVWLYDALALADVAPAMP